MMGFQTFKKVIWYPPKDRKNGSAGAYSREFPWKILYYRVTVCSVPLILLGILGAGIARGLAGLAGFIFGFLIVYICLTLSIITVLGATRLRLGIPQALLVGYVVKTTLMGVVLMTVPIPEVVKHGWTLAGAVVGAVLWLGVEMATIKNMRVLYFDSGS